jgi:cardiolipin synthase A/B
VLQCAGCSGLPLIVPDLFVSGSALVRVEGSRGPLTAQRSQAILEALSKGGQATNIFERHLALEEALVGSPLTAGNQVTLLEDGPATYRAMLAAIEAAGDHIHMETYILDDDEVGRHFAKALIASRQRGVHVRLIRDSAGTFSTPKPFFDGLTEAGVQVLEFNPLNPLMSRGTWELNQRDHRKLLIVDGHVAFLGGINISSVYSSASFRRRPDKRPDGALEWRDTDLQLRGPVVAELQKLFLATWSVQKGPALDTAHAFPQPVAAGHHVVRAIGSSPDEPFSLIYATLLSAIGSAETSVSITNAYFAPDPQLLDTLEAAASRGVDVRLILPSRTDSWLVFHAGRGYYERLLKAGVKVYERRGVILHSKTALVDGVWATVGSTNLDWRSFLHNHELNAVVLGAEFGGQLQAMFARDLAQSDEILLTQWQTRAWRLRAQELFARLWAYWL